MNSTQEEIKVENQIKPDTKKRPRIVVLKFKSEYMPYTSVNIPREYEEC